MIGGTVLNIGLETCSKKGESDMTHGALFTSAIALAIGTISPAWAQAAGDAPIQAAPSDEAPAQAEDSALIAKDIVVTATRRPQELQKIPAAVTVLDGATIEKISPTNIGAVLNLVPGVSYTGESTYRSALTIRGVSGSNEDAAVAMYLDGVYVGHDLGQNLSNLDPESIQVLRGPQGALYGKNTLGGAVIVSSRRPTFNTHVSLLGGYGDANSYNLRGSMTGAIVPDKVAGYVFGYAAGNDGRYYNIFDNRHVGSRRAYGGQAALLFQVSDATSVTFRGDYSRNRFEEANRKGLFATGTFLRNELSTGYNDKVALDFVGFGLVKNYGALMNVTVEADPFTLTSVTAYRGYHVRDLRDVDGTGRPFGSAGILQDQDQISQEFTLTSRGKKRFNWIVGAQLFHENLDETFSVNDLVGGVVRPGLAGRAPVTYVYDTKGYKTDSIALYAQADFLITEGLTMAAGARYSIDDRKYLKTETQYLSNPSAIGFQYLYPERASYSALTPEASLSYEFTPTVSIYGKYGKSYRPGGFNVNPVLNPAAQNEFGKESANSYEAGLRTRFAGNRLTFNVTAFRIDWKDQQVSFINQVGAFTVANVQSRSQGVEVEANANVSRAFQIGASGTYLDATFGSIVFPTRDPVTRVPFFANANGTPLNFAPKWSGSLYGTYTHRFDDERSLSLRTDVSYKSRQSVQPLRPDVAGPPITRINGRLEYDFGRFVAALWIKNALNRFSNYTSQSTATLDVIGLTEPRTFGAEFGFKL